MSVRLENMLSRNLLSLFRRRKVYTDPPPWEPLTQGDDEYRQTRYATNAGPQLLTLVVDHSVSMTDGNKAEEATRILQNVLEHACEVNCSLDSTGEKTYFYTQVILFAETYEDSTRGMKRPRNEPTSAQGFRVRQSKTKEVNVRLGDLTNYQKPLAHVYKTLSGRQGMTHKRLAAAMPAPIVLLITDGIASFPKGIGIEPALEEAERIKALCLPEVKSWHPLFEKIAYPADQVRIVAIGVGAEGEFDPVLLTQLCTHVEYKGEDLPLYLHCPRPKDLSRIGPEPSPGDITGSDEAEKTLEDVIYTIRQSLGMQAK